MIQAALFDMDGVMFDTEKIYNEAWQYAAKRQGKTISHGMILAIKGSCRAVSSQMLKSELGEGFDVERAVEDRDRFTREYIDENGLPVKPGLMELLRFLREKDIRVSLASSTKLSIVRRYFDLAGLDPWFDGIVCGNMVERGKPEPDIFLMAAERLGVPPENSVVLEDSLNGIRGGRRAGCKVIMIPDCILPTEEDAAFFDRKADSLFDVISIIQEWNRE